MTTLKEVYPFATSDGKAIPLDIIYPSALVKLTNGQSFTLAAGYEVAAIHAFGAEAILSFNGALGSVNTATLYEDTVFIPPNGLAIVRLPSATVHVITGTGGVVYIQLIEKWAGLALPSQFNRK